MRELDELIAENEKLKRALYDRTQQLNELRGSLYPNRGTERIDDHIDHQSYPNVYREGVITHMASNWYAVPVGDDAESISSTFKDQGYELKDSFRGSDLATGIAGPIEEGRLQSLLQNVPTVSGMHGVFISPDQQRARNVAQRLTGQQGSSGNR